MTMKNDEIFKASKKGLPSCCIHPYSLPPTCYLHAKICLTGDAIRRIDIVSRCFENKNNNCCEIKLGKNAIRLLLINLQIHDLATLMPGHPSHRVARYGFVNL